MTPELLAALEVLIGEHFGDWIYNVRSRAGEDETYDGNTWDHPRVKAYSDAVITITRAVSEAKANGT